MDGSAYSPLRSSQAAKLTIAITTGNFSTPRTSPRLFALSPTSCTFTTPPTGQRTSSTNFVWRASPAAAFRQARTLLLLSLSLRRRCVSSELCPKSASISELTFGVRLRQGAPASVKIHSLTSLSSMSGSKTFYKADKIQMKWNKSGTNLLFLTQTEVDKTGKSYYGESNLYLMAAAGQFDCRVTLGASVRPSCLTSSWSSRTDF